MHLWVGARGCRGVCPDVVVFKGWVVGWSVGGRKGRGHEHVAPYSTPQVFEGVHLREWAWWGVNGGVHPTPPHLNEVQAIRGTRRLATKTRT